MQVQVIYAEPERSLDCWLEVKAGATVADCLALAAAAPQFAAVDVNQCAVGIFGERCEPTRVVAENDRIELYRPLHNDAKAARRLRARQQAQSGKGQR